MLALPDGLSDLTTKEVLFFSSQMCRALVSIAVVCALEPILFRVVGASTYTLWQIQCFSHISIMETNVCCHSRTNKNLMNLQETWKI